MKARGFTLVEMVTVLALIALAAFLSAPYLVAFQRNSELRSAAGSFLSSLGTARSEAMKRDRNVYVVPLASTDWASGWRVFSDENWNQAYDAGTDIDLMQQPALPSHVTIESTAQARGFVDGGNAYVLFNGGGYPRSNGGAFAGGAIEFATYGASDSRRRVVLTPIGRVRICNPATDASSDCRQ